MTEEHSKFTGPKSAFDDVDLSHLVLKTLSEMGHDVQDSQKFLNRLRHIDYGLSAQTECAAILAWLGNCVLVHELAQEGYCSTNLGDVQIPDLLAVFSSRDEQLRTVIEVKCTDELYVPWTKEYRNKLAKYGELLGVPVLLAWRPRKLGEWILVDALSEELVTDGRIRLEDAIVHNLMGVIAGDLYVDPEPGIGVNFRGQIIGDRSPTENGFTAKIKITSAFFGTRKGDILEQLNASSTALILTTASEHYCEEQGDTISWGYLTPETPPREVGGVSAQNLLRTLVGWVKKDDERIAWRHVLNRIEEVKSKTEMENELQQDIGKTVRYIFHLQPKTLPSFLPSAWGRPASERKSSDLPK